MLTAAVLPPCALCAGETRAFCEDRARRYFECSRCALVMADPASHLSAAEERAIYDLHRNDPADARYRAFLARLAEPLRAKLVPGMRGLDFGCGPGPVLAVMLREAGMAMAEYDPFYAPDATLLETQYDFVTCTEVVEHFRDPLAGWTQLAALVRSGGWLGVMTQLAPERPENFLRWRYRDDRTHVSFHRLATLQWLAARFGFALEQVERQAFLLRRQG
ncbi:MAG: class I SAM-dependent methyltransferase [Pseudomonadota bacterium]